MKIAVTVWENRISPVFDASRRLLVATIEKGCMVDRSYVIFDPALPANLAKILLRLEVPVLICGAVSQVPATVLTAAGITLVPFITGQVEPVLAAYAQGTPLAPTFTMPGCHDDPPAARKAAKPRSPGSPPDNPLMDRRTP
jgi:predicted Fe-Mo cluster-binding NifX family protein